jgi:hypothetical protein
MIQIADPDIEVLQKWTERGVGERRGIGRGGPGEGLLDDYRERRLREG